MTFVIVADDDEMVLDIVRAALAKRGHAVGVLTDGKSVRKVVELKRPDVVILDCSMEHSGITALKEIRLSAMVYDTPVLMLTARSSVADEKIALLAGADDYLCKPFDPDEVVARVEALVAKTCRAHSASTTGPGSGAVRL